MCWPVSWEGIAPQKMHFLTGSVILFPMSDLDDTDQRRDSLLLRLLKTPPKPRPKRERDAKKSNAEAASPASEETPSRSA